MAFARGVDTTFEGQSGHAPNVATMRFRYRIRVDMNNVAEVTTSKRKRAKPSIWRRFFAWGPFGFVVLLWFSSCLVESKFRSRRVKDTSLWHFDVTNHAGMIKFEYYWNEDGNQGRERPLNPIRWKIRHSRPAVDPNLSFFFPSLDWDHEYEVGIWGGRYVHVDLPHWIMALAASLWVALLVFCRKLRKPTECLKCGYDLRGSTRTCPECGAVQQAKRAKA